MTRSPAQAPLPYHATRLPMTHPKRDEGFRWGYTNGEGAVFGYAKTRKEAEVWADSLKSQESLALAGVA